MYSRPTCSCVRRVRLVLTIRILLVCAANVCRSPMAEAILSRLLARRAVPAEIASAGLLGGGRPMPSEALDALATLSDSGPDMSAHWSRALTAMDVERADPSSHDAGARARSGRARPGGMELDVHP
jgi:hypothetical protein